MITNQKEKMISNEVLLADFCTLFTFQKLSLPCFFFFLLAWTISQYLVVMSFFDCLYLEQFLSLIAFYSLAC